MAGNLITWNLVGSLITGSLTAIVTVVLTFLFYKRRDKIRSLRAVQSEIEQNREIAEDLKPYLSQDIKWSVSNSERTDSLGQFHTSAFRSALNNGVLMTIQEETRNSILNHYQDIEKINDQIDYREQLRAGSGRSMGSYRDRRVSLNVLILQLLQKQLSEDLRDQLEEALEDVEDSPTAEFVSPGDTVTFDELETQIDGELQSHRFLRKVI